MAITPKGIDRSHKGPLAFILATAVNQDGRSSSLTAPNGPAQSKLIGKAIVMGGINPYSISSIVVHGTGELHWSHSSSREPLEMRDDNILFYTTPVPLYC